MDEFSEIPPATLSVELTEEGVTVSYMDGRDVLYRGVPQKVTTPYETTPGKDVHVLVTDPSEVTGVLVYLNERTTDDEILDDSGVGRVLVEEDEEAMVFPGVTATGGQLRTEITVDHETVDGRVFVFEEDQFEEHSYELVAESEQ